MKTKNNLIICLCAVLEPVMTFTLLYKIRSKLFFTALILPEKLLYAWFGITLNF